MSCLMVTEIVDRFRIIFSDARWMSAEASIMLTFCISAKPKINCISMFSSSICWGVVKPSYLNCTYRNPFTLRILSRHCPFRISGLTFLRSLLEACLLTLSTSQLSRLRFGHTLAGVAYAIYVSHWRYSGYFRVRDPCTSA